VLRLHRVAWPYASCDGWTVPVDGRSEPLPEAMLIPNEFSPVARSDRFDMRPILEASNTRASSTLPLSASGCLLPDRHLIPAPMDAIDYANLQELCHMVEPHHDAALFEHLE